MRNDNLEEDVISTEQVTAFLRAEPHFFEKNAHLLTEISLPNPHGSGAISLAERQQLAHRDKIRLLEVKLSQLIEFAEENDDTSAKVHQLVLSLIATKDFIDLQKALFDGMVSDFGVTESTLLIWLKSEDESLNLHPAFKPVSEIFSDWVISLKTPYTGPVPIEANGLVAEHLQSFAFIPLINSARPRAIGVLILSSDKPHKFQVGMGTLYLQRIGELVTAMLLKHI